MIVYHGSIKRFEYFTKDSVVQNLSNDIDTIGFWFTADLQSAKPFAIGTETVIQKSETEFWEDGEPKVIQFYRPVKGFIYKVYIGEPNLKVYGSSNGDSYDLFMKERDQYCDYLGSVTWKDKGILLNKDEANAVFRNHLASQGYDGFFIQNTKLPGGVTDLYCIFSESSLQIAEVIPVDDTG